MYVLTNERFGAGGSADLTSLTQICLIISKPELVQELLQDDPCLASIGVLGKEVRASTLTNQHRWTVAIPSNAQPIFIH